MSYKRTIEDALEVIGHAKHSKDEVCSVTQVFYHPSAEECSVTESSMRLIDVDETFIERLEDGESFVFRGCDDDKLVLCTEKETFEVKEGEISNSLVFIPDLSFSCDISKEVSSDHTVQEKKIVGMLNSYLELRPTFPKLSKLRKILSEALYKGPEEEESSENKGYYLCDLLNIIQSSREELLCGLRDLSACCLDNRWRLLDVEYETRVLSYIINLAEKETWTTISRKDCYRILSSVVPAIVLEYIFDRFTMACEEDDDLRTWIPLKLCRSFAEMLLTACGGNFRYNEFIMAWRECLPKGMNPELKSLRGLALMEQEGTQQQIVCLFPEYELTENISERFRLLFKKKEKWTLEEIEPYIEKLASKGVNVSTMLTKFSRPSTQNGVRVFGSRHVK